jgi:PKD repeat protein
MGVGYYKNVTQWSSGAYPGANNKQDDLAVMASNGFVQRTDDVGNTFTTASSLTNVDAGTLATIQAFGVIENSNDVDMYRIDTAGGLIDLMFKPTSTGSNLDTKLTLFKTSGVTVATSAPEIELSSSISTSVPAGTYFLSVKGSAHVASGSDYGYPVYGSLGQYQITGSYASSGIAAAPTAVLTASTLTGPASLAVNFSANSSVGNGSIIGYQWSFGDGTYSTSAMPVHSYTKAGTYIATLTVTNQYLLTNSQMVEITVTPPPPATFYASSLGMTVIKSSNVVAKINITVKDDKGRLIPNAVVTGTWSGSFSGTVSSKTGTNGVVVQAANAIPLTTGGSATYTISRIEASGYIYNPDRNIKSVVTVSW